MPRIFIKPLSANKAFAGRKFRTPDYDAYEIELCKELRKMKKQIIPKDTKLVLTLEFGFSSKASDVSNALKQTEDILCRFFGYNDKWHYEIHLYKKIVKKSFEYVDFTISQLK